MMVKHMGVNGWEPGRVFTLKRLNATRYRVEDLDSNLSTCFLNEYTVPFHDTIPNITPNSNGAMYADLATGHVFTKFGGKFYCMTLSPGRRIRTRTVAESHWTYLGSLVGMGAHFLQSYIQGQQHSG